MIGPRLLLLILATVLTILPSVCAADMLTGDYLAHDPSRIVKCDGKYYFYCTGPDCPMHVSTDLVHWEIGPPVLSAIPDWARTAVPGNKGDWIWAPDLIALNGKYYLFYAFSTFGRKVSVIGLASSPTLDPSNPDYHWTDLGDVVSSNDQSDFNAIDPCPVQDEHGDLWLSFGSWFGKGIVLVKLDKTTMKPISDYYSLAAKQSTGPEGSYIYRHGGYYYLFENEGLCCQGMNSTYRIMMGRSKSITGPYLDKDGKSLADGGGSLFLGTEGVRIGPGQIGILREDGIDRFSFHYYDGTANGRPTLGIEPLIWGSNGWPRAGNDLALGHYAIIDRSTGLALTIAAGDYDDGTPLHEEANHGAANQAWNVCQTGDGHYALSSLATGKYLDLSNCDGHDGDPIDQCRWLDNDCQRWRIEETEDNSYRIVCKNGGGVVTGSGTTVGTVQIFTWQGRAGQEWIFKQVE